MGFFCKSEHANISLMKTFVVGHRRLPTERPPVFVASLHTYRADTGSKSTGRKAKFQLTFKLNVGHKRCIASFAFFIVSASHWFYVSMFFISAFVRTYDFSIRLFVSLGMCFLLAFLCMFLLLVGSIFFSFCLSMYLGMFSICLSVFLCFLSAFLYPQVCVFYQPFYVPRQVLYLSFYVPMFFLSAFVGLYLGMFFYLYFSFNYLSILISFGVFCLFILSSTFLNCSSPFTIDSSRFFITGDRTWMTPIKVEYGLIRKPTQVLVLRT